MVKTPFLMLALLGHLNVMGQCSFDFAVSDSSICQNDKVEFSILNLPSSYKSINWELGIRTAKGEAKPSALYTKTGNFTISLIIDDGTKLCTVKKVDFLEVKPTPDMGTVVTSRTEACATGESVQFTSTSVNATDWSWSIEGKSYTGSKSASHWFLFNGRPIVQLTVENKFGCTNSKIFDSLVHVLDRPSVTFDSINLRACEVPGTISPRPKYDLKGAKVASYIWKFDGATFPSDLGFRPRSKSYNMSGRYDVHLTLRTKGGCSFSYDFDKMVRIANIPKVELKAVPITGDGCKTMRYMIVAHGDVNPNELRWSVNQAVIESADFTHLDSAYILFRKEGKHIVRCTVEKANCKNEYSVTVNAEDGDVRAKFEAPECICHIPDLLTIKNESSSSRPLTYRWSILREDKEIFNSTDKDLRYKVTKDGDITVVLRATDPDGCYDEQLTDIDVGSISLDASAVPDRGCEGDKVNLVLRNECGIEDKDVHFYFFDEKNKLVKKSTGKSPVMNFGKGQFSVAVSVKNDQGCRDSIYLKNHLRVDDCLEGLEAALKDPVGFCVGLVKIPFVPETPVLVELEMEAYLVLASDTTYQVKGKYNPIFQEVSFVPQLPGTYHVVLHVKIKGSTITKTLRYKDYVKITKLEVEGKIGTVTGCFPNKEVELSIANVTNDLKGISEDSSVTYHWTAYPTNKTVVWTQYMENTRLTIQENGGVQVQVVITNSLGCQAVWQSKGDLVESFEAKFKTPDSLCFGDSIVFKNKSEGSIVSYEWSSSKASDVFEPSTAATHPNLKVVDEGKRTIGLVVIDRLGCTDTFSLEMELVDLEIGFEVEDTTAKCSPSVHEFKATSKNATRYIWDFGDGDRITTKQTDISKIYDLTRVNPYRNLFTVTLTGVHPSGCRQRVTKKHIIRVLGPWPKFEIGPLKGCSPLTTQFVDKSENIEKLYFDYQDGSPIDSGLIVSHTYRMTDTSKTYQGFQPIIVATDKGGCKVSLRVDDTVKVYSSPIARFGAKERIGCESFEAKLTSHSSHAKFFDWRITTGSKILQSSADSGYFGLPSGIYDAFLRVGNDADCWDSIDKPGYFEVYQKPQAFFEPQDSISCIGKKFSFYDKSVSDVAMKTWRWDMLYSEYPGFKDSAFTANYSPTFVLDGHLEVRLIVSNDNNCYDTLIRHKVVNVYELLPVEASQIQWVTHTKNEEVAMQWTNSDPAYFRKFNLYRIDLDVDELVGTWESNQSESTYFNDFLDTSSSCYQLEMIDRCLDVHPSDTHCTVHLEVDDDVKKTANLTWTPYRGWNEMDGYEISRTSNGSWFQPLAKVPPTQLSFVDSNFCDSTYQYRVEAISKNLKSRSNDDLFRPEFTYQNVPLEITRVSVDGNKEIRVNWQRSKQLGKVQYQVSREAEDGSLNRWWQTVSDTFAIDSNARIHDYFYTYRVKVKDQCNNVAGASNVGRSIVLKVDQSNDDVVLHWNRYQKWAEGVSHYVVQVKAPGSKKFETIGEVLDSFFNDEEAFLKYEDAYAYRVVAIENVLVPDSSYSNEKRVVPVPSVFAANAFTPNGDGRNDEFKVIGWALIEDSVELESFQMRLYNRWGVEMFETDNINNGWDGTFRGRNAPLDQYIWLAKVTGLNGQVYFLRGGVLLMR